VWEGLKNYGILYSSSQKEVSKDGMRQEYTCTYGGNPEEARRVIYEFFQVLE
jgi:hypothetical protein